MTELIEFLSYGFIQRALIAGIITAIVSAALGVFVLLRRMSFFSDAIAHASLLGVALGLLLNINMTVGAIAVSILIGISIASMAKDRTLASDTIIGVVFSSSVALAVFIISLMDSVSVDLTSLLFGDILAVSKVDIWFTVVVAVLTIIFIRVFSKSMLKMIFNRDLAGVESKTVEMMDYLFLALLAVVIAVSLKIVGAILISALIIIPAATAQNISRNIRQMFVISIIVGIVSVILGMFFSFIFDSPSGSTIVLVSSVLFIVSILFKK